MAALRVVVVGAGAFGGWTALALVRAGASVTLVDAWGPGNARASSGGETRLIRSVYGPDGFYSDLAAASWQDWRDLEAVSATRFLVRTGALWLFSVEDDYLQSARPHLDQLGFGLVPLSKVELQQRYPWLRVDDLRTQYLEEEAGYLFARRACETVWERVHREGGTVRRASVVPGPIKNGRLTSVTLNDGSCLEADVFVFATGPWLGQTFPEVVGGLIKPTRQDVFFFGLPAGTDWVRSMPAWMDYGERIFYGVPDGEYRGFKAADDTRGPQIDPTTLERVPCPEALARIRAAVTWRFPRLTDLPVVEARVCQYENTPDGHFLIDRHPEASNCRLLGGGSGHGFKMGPAMGRLMAQAILEDQHTDPRWALARFANGVFEGQEQLRKK